MTLRVTLEIVPHGDETKKYKIGSMNISNLMGSETCEYYAALYSDGETLLKETSDGTLVHKSSDGAWTLVKKAIESLKP